MKHSLILFFCTLIFNLLASSCLFAQSWNFVKEKEGIKVFTRIEPNSSLKAFKGETILQAPVDKVSILIMDPKNSDWWKANFAQRELIDYKEDKYVQYYLVYGLPWPLINRDFAAETRMTKDSVTGEQIMISLPMLNKVPTNPDLIRINKYLQKWTLQPLDKQTVHVILEGFIDPGGNLPAWLYNIVIPEAPFKIINSLRDRLLSEKQVQSGT
jgi:hypothetical protein